MDIFMRISNEVSIDRLSPGKKYIIDVNWNDTNTLRIERDYLLHGVFKRLEYVKGRAYSYDSGLSVLLSPSRINAIFDINGQTCKISSANRFYEQCHIHKDDIVAYYAIHCIQLPNDVKREIGKYL